ncbi:MAG TPA: cytochrome c-550 PedF [Albidovulum sp.]|uniref:cytochrome c-550 PedF n=1 Tax=Albidovulum sp. TaxID=1872424 RepID=UPI002CD2A9AC|nr:cytochrome c-550 PedF [Albidovulum sp.]
MTFLREAALAAGLVFAAGVANSAGLPLTIEPVNTDALPDVGDEWLTENPFRADKAGDEVWQKAIEIGESGFVQNCARCHGLGAVSGGLAPDLRYLEAAEYGDEWFIERFRQGYTQDNITRMPAFGNILGQKAAWAIRTYIETQPEDGALGEVTPRLKEIRDSLVAGSGDGPAVKTELLAIAAEIKTSSGAPVADSAPLRAAHMLSDDPASWKKAAEALTIGMSAAH